MVTPSGRRNNPAVHWNVSSVQIMIGFVEKHKGIKSPLIAKQHTAIEQLCAKLRPSLDTENASRITPSRARDKLTHIWKNRLNQYHQIRDFWIHGLAALNQTALENEYLGIDFEKIMQWGNDADDSDDDQPELSSSKRERSESSDDMTEAPVAKKPRNKPVSVRSASGSTLVATAGTQTPVPLASQEEDITAALLRSRDNDGNEIVDTDDEEASPTGQNDQPTKSHAIPRAAKPCPPALAIPTPAHWSLTPPPRFPLREPVYTLFCSREKVNDQVNGLRKQIHLAVHGYLLGIGFSDKQPVLMDLNTMPSPELQALFNLVTGTIHHGWAFAKDFLEKLLGSEHGRHLSLNIVVQGLIGAAVQLWCLMPFEGNSWWKYHAMDPEVQLQLRDSMDDENFQGFKLKAIRTYIQTKFAQNIPRLAAEQAKLFDRQMAYLMPKRPASRITNGKALFTSPNPWVVDPVMAVNGFRLNNPPKTASESSKQAASGETSKTSPSKKAHDEWIKDLSDIFNNALKLRALMEMPYEQGSLSEMEYTFDFPLYHDDEEKRAGHPKETRIMAGMFPEINAIEVTKRILGFGGFIPTRLDPFQLVQAKAHPVDLV